MIMNLIVLPKRNDIVENLNQVLEKHPNLVYDKKESERAKNSPEPIKCLRIKRKTDSNEPLNISIAGDICKDLEGRTGIQYFFLRAPNSNWDDWKHFNIYAAEFP